jgi:membrane protease YdiL (CAAX protease family)
VALLVAVSWRGANSQHVLAQKHGRVIFYVSTMAGEWLLLAYVMWGVRKRGVTLHELTGGRWAEFEDALLDVAIAFAFWVVALIVLAAVAFIVGIVSGQVGANAAANASTMAERCAEVKRNIGFLAPGSRTEVLVFLAVAATAGFCEEIIFRGYLQRQFTSLSGFASIGLLAQAALFGLSHGYQGARSMIVIGAYGALFGLLAQWGRSLRPGMMTHALHDGVVGSLITPLLRTMRC